MLFKDIIIYLYTFVVYRILVLKCMSNFYFLFWFSLIDCCMIFLWELLLFLHIQTWDISSQIFNICKIKSTIYDLFQQILPIASIVKNISFLVFGFPFDARQQFKTLLILKGLKGLIGRGHLYIIFTSIIWRALYKIYQKYVKYLNFVFPM